MFCFGFVIVLWLRLLVFSIISVLIGCVVRKKVLCVLIMKLLIIRFLVKILCDSGLLVLFSVIWISVVLLVIEI